MRGVGAKSSLDRAFLKAATKIRHKAVPIRKATSTRRFVRVLVRRCATMLSVSAPKNTCLLRTMVGCWHTIDRALCSTRSSEVRSAMTSQVLWFLYLAAEHTQFKARRLCPRRVRQRSACRVSASVDLPTGLSEFSSMDSLRVVVILTTDIDAEQFDDKFHDCAGRRLDIAIQWSVGPRGSLS
ncbi:hypothetical protein MRB53_041719 [Persea americana]|nr:hypothetical protein MRB53_041719 [Persea americana]